MNVYKQGKKCGQNLKCWCCCCCLSSGLTSKSYWIFKWPFVVLVRLFSPYSSPNLRIRSLTVHTHTHSIKCRVVSYRSVAFYSHNFLLCKHFSLSFFFFKKRINSCFISSYPLPLSSSLLLLSCLPGCLNKHEMIICFVSP